MSRLLIYEEPLLVLPGLAVEIGLNEALFLQQVHYWIQKSKHEYDGKKWVYNTYDGWAEQFPFWSVRTLQRIVSSLEKKELLITGNYNKIAIDKTKWYTIDYQKLELVARPPRQSGMSNTSSWHDDSDNLTKAIPKTTTKITTEIKKNNAHSEEFAQFWANYPKRRDKQKAIAAFKKARKKHSLEIIMNGLSAYVDYLKKNSTETQFIKHASTFLNNESFLDDFGPDDGGGGNAGSPEQPKQAYNLGF